MKERIGRGSCFKGWTVVKGGTRGSFSTDIGTKPHQRNGGRRGTKRRSWGLLYSTRQNRTLGHRRMKLANNTGCCGGIGSDSWGDTNGKRRQLLLMRQLCSIAFLSP